MRPPLVIIGPTASGKSALALDLAERAIAVGVPTEIVSADAMAVYRGMDIGTAKPSVAEQARVPHHLVDVVGPEFDFTVSEFSHRVTEVLADLDQRGVTPILVGGTGLYVRSVVDDFVIPDQFPEVRARLETEEDTTVLHRRLRELDEVAAAKMEPNNRRRVVRALEVTIGSGQPFSSFGPGVDAYGPTRFRQAGLVIDRAVLDKRISERYDRQMADGFLDEVRALAAGELSRTARQALGYKELLDHLGGGVDLEEALALANQRTRRFARRQERWFRRDPRIDWFEAEDDDLVDQIESWWCASPTDGDGKLDP